jgi:hypothetical protein
MAIEENTSTHTAAAGQTATAPRRCIQGRLAAVPSSRPATAYMPSGKTTIQARGEKRGLDGGRGNQTIRLIPAAVKIYICDPSHRLAKAHTDASH